MAKKRSYGVELVIRGKDLVSGIVGRVGKSLRGLKGIASGVGSLIEKVPGIALLGMGVSSLATSLRDLVMRVGDLGGELTDLSAATGIGTAAIQNIGFAFQKSGVETEEYHSGLRKMIDTLGDGVKAARFVGTLGKGASGFAQALKATKDPAQQLELILAQMASIESPAKRAAFASIFFGKAGVKMAAAAADGADGLKRMRAEAEALGQVMTEDEIKRADEFSDSYESLGMVLEGSKRGFASGLIEGLLPAMRDLLGWTKGNRKEIGAFIRELGRTVGSGLVTAAKAIGSAFEWIVANKSTVLDVMKGVGIGVTALLGLSALGPILAALAASPLFGLIIAAVAGVTWLLANAPIKTTTEKQNDRGFVDSVKENGWAGGLGASFFGMTNALLGYATNPNEDTADALTGRVGQYGRSLFDQDALLAEAQDRQRAENFRDSDSFNRGIMDAVRMGRDPGSFSGLDLSPGGPLQDQSVEVKVVIEDKGGNVEGKPEVKGTPGVKAKTEVKNTGRRSQDFSKGGL